MPIAPSRDYTFGPMETDKETGLPYLPEDLAWSVSRSSTAGTVKLSVVINLGGDWVEFVDGHYIFTSPSSESLKTTAAYLYEKIREEQKLNAQVEELVGLYPPNSL